MTYQEAKAIKTELENRTNELSKLLNSYEKNEMGLVPYEVARTKEYQEAKNSYDSFFIKLQNFNSYFIKTFKKEYLKERRQSKNVNK